MFDNVLAPLAPIVACSVFATWQAVEIWHHSAIMATPRAYAQTIEGFLGRLLTCPYCLSVWVGGVFALLGTVALLLCAGGHVLAALLVLLPSQVLAVSRLANLFNDLSRPFCRTPKENKLPATANTANQMESQRVSVAFLEGVSAFREGADVNEDNPYNPRQYQRRYEAWQEGFLTAGQAQELRPLNELLKAGN